MAPISTADLAQRTTNETISSSAKSTNSKPQPETNPKSKSWPFEEFTFPGQQITSDFGYGYGNPAQTTSSPKVQQQPKLFPLALKPSAEWTPETIDDAVEAITTLRESGALLDLVKEHGGAILFRGLPIKTALDYSRVAHAFGFRPHEEVGRPPLRTVLAPNVKTANEGPPELPIWPHNEYGWSTINPAWLTFSALSVPETGGATPIISSIGLAKALEEKAPQFFQSLLEKGVKYVYRYPRQDSVSTVGTSVFSAYGQTIRDGDDEDTIRRKIEAEVRRHSDRFEWHEDGSISVTHIVPSEFALPFHQFRLPVTLDNASFSLRSLDSRQQNLLLLLYATITITNTVVIYQWLTLRCTVIRKHTPTGHTTWFGNLTSAYGRSRHHGATQPPFLGDDGGYHPLPTYGDGSPINTEDLELALSIAEGMQVDVEWEVGDVVLLDVS
ncbi:hypothetical protein HRR77_004731 [Exophiala dermatitidis]|nr:hypothetical protein HRR77_004731 [Exophiala dermatitidis]